MICYLSPLDRKLKKYFPTAGRVINVLFCKSLFERRRNFSFKMLLNTSLQDLLVKLSILPEFALYHVAITVCGK